MLTQLSSLKAKFNNEFSVRNWINEIPACGSKFIGGSILQMLCLHGTPTTSLTPGAQLTVRFSPIPAGRHRQVRVATYRCT